MRLGILIPVYQANGSLPLLLTELSQCLSKTYDQVTFIIVDDGSDLVQAKAIIQDVSQNPQTIILTHPKNLGKGAALKTGIAYAQKNDLDFVVTADADGQHAAKDILNIAKQSKKLDQFVIGVRAFDGDVPMRSHFGNVLTSFLFRLVVGVKLSDTQSGLRALPARLYSKLLSIRQNRYEFEFQSLLNLSKQEPIHQVPIETIYDVGNPSSHFRPLIDSALIYFVFVRYVFSVLLIATADMGAFFVLMKVIDPFYAFGIVRVVSVVRRHIKWHRFRPGLRETLLTSLVDIKRRLCGIASVDVR